MTQVRAANGGLYKAPLHNIKLLTVGADFIVLCIIPMVLQLSDDRTIEPSIPIKIVHGGHFIL